MSEKQFTFEYDDGQWGVPLFYDDGKKLCFDEVVGKLNEQQATITKLEQICEKKMQEIENIKYSLKEIAYKYQKEVQFKADTDPNQAVKEVLCEQQATIINLQGDVNRLNYIIEELKKDNYKQFEKINELKAKLKEKEEDEKLYANEILELNKTKKEMLNFRNLGSDY